MSIKVGITKRTEGFYEYGHEKKKKKTLRGRSISDTQLANCSKDVIYLLINV